MCLVGGIYLLLLESEIERLLELGFCSVDADPLIFFPLVAELLSPNEFLFLAVSFLRPKLEPDDEQFDGTISEIELHRMFFKPYLAVLAFAFALVLVDPASDDEDGLAKLARLANPFLWFKVL